MPLLVMVPPVADQPTAVLLEPLTLAVNCWVLPAWTDAVVGETLTVTAGAAALADLPVNVHPARYNTMNERIAAIRMFARTCWGTRRAGDTMLFPLSISSQELGLS